MNVIDGRMGLQAAIDAPKIAFVEPDIIVVENEIKELETSIPRI